MTCSSVCAAAHELGSRCAILRGRFRCPATRSSTIRFADGTAWTAATVRSLTNLAPVRAVPLADGSIIQGTSLSYVVPEATFVDPDIGDVLALLVTHSQTRSSVAGMDEFRRRDAGIRRQQHLGEPGADRHPGDGDRTPQGLSVDDVFDLTVRAPPDGYVITGTPGDDVLRAGTAPATPCMAEPTRRRFFGGIGGNALYERQQRLLGQWRQPGETRSSGGPRRRHLRDHDSTDVVLTELPGGGIDSVRSGIPASRPHCQSREPHADRQRHRSTRLAMAATTS